MNTFITRFYYELNSGTPEHPETYNVLYHTTEVQVPDGNPNPYTMITNLIMVLDGRMRTEVQQESQTEDSIVRARSINGYGGQPRVVQMESGNKRIEGNLATYHGEHLTMGSNYHQKANLNHTNRFDLVPANDKFGNKLVDQYKDIDADAVHPSVVVGLLHGRDLRENVQTRLRGTASEDHLLKDFHIEGISDVYQYESHNKMASLCRQNC